ncbi:MAG: hypothetical protein ACRDF7_01505 [Candidatus Limnocylindrales bacterium]
MRQGLARLARVAAIAAIGLLAAGLLILAVGAVIAGDLYALRQPWAGWGIPLAVIGLAATALALGARVLVEPLGWSRLTAVPPALVTVGLWAILLFYGLGGGACCVPTPPADVGTLLYSAPNYAALLIAATLLIGLPLALRRLRTRIRARSS